MKLRLVSGIAILLLMSLSAFAGSVAMQFNSAGPFSYYGVSSYPYNVTVDGDPASLMCVELQRAHQWWRDLAGDCVSRSMPTVR